MRAVAVVDYNALWPQLFAAESKLLRATLGDVALAIHHMGSTAVPGLAAKPVIDILLEVRELDALEKLNRRMIGIGYEPKGELGIPGRRYFRKGGDYRTHHLHAFMSGDLNLTRHLAFRDYLREHPAVAEEYARVKRDVARTCGHDPARYSDGKAAYVKRIEAIAVGAKNARQGAEANAHRAT